MCMDIRTHAHTCTCYMHSNDELGDAVSDLATRSTPADSSSMSNPMRHFPGRRPIPSYSSDNESSGGIVFGDLSAQNSTDNSRLAASPLFTTSASRSNSSSYTDGIIARGTDGDDSSTSCTDTSVMSKALRAICVAVLF